MASKYIAIEGVVEWAKLFEHNRDKEGYNGAYAETNGRTTMNLNIEKSDYDKLKGAGFMGRGEPVGDKIKVKLTRKWETGRDWDSGQAEILRADGNSWDVDTDGEIGNGSVLRVLVILTPFPQVNATSTRFEKVKVLEHVPYGNNDRDGFYTDESSANPPNSPAPETSSGAMEEDMDEIPF